MLYRLNPLVRFVGAVKVGEANTHTRVGRDNRMFYFTSGKATLVVGGRAYSVAKHTLAFVPSYTEYRFELRGDDVTLICTNFDVTADESRAETHEKPIELSSWDGVRRGEELPPEFSRPIIIKDAESVAKDVARLYKIFFAGEDYYADFASLYMKKILLFALTRGGDERPSGSAERAVEYIRENFRERITAAELARHLGYHPNHLNRVVKAYTGMTLKSYLIATRIAAAKEMLASGDTPITDISESCGFSTPSYFSELFLRSEGITPREYRKKMRSIII